MADEAESEYTEVIELPTLTKHRSEVLLMPTESTEDEGVLETYLNMDKCQEKESSPEAPNCPKSNISRGHCLSGPITYKKAPKIEDMNCLHYENVSVSSSTLARSDAPRGASIPAEGIIETGFPQNALTTSDVDYIDCFYYESLTTPSTSHKRAESNCADHLSTSGNNQHIENNLTLCKKLEISRRKMRCFEFTCYAMWAVYKEVEDNAAIEVISSFFSLGILVIGFIYLDGCKASTQIPVLLVCSGIMDLVASVISFIIILKNSSRKYLCWRDITRAIRSVMLVAHIYGLVLVYEALYSEEIDKSSAKYCNAYLYWSGFAYFHTFLLTSVSTMIAMITFSLFYLFKKNKYVF